MICTYCKADNQEDCLYCPKCGKPASGSADAVRTNTSTEPGEESTLREAEICQTTVFGDFPLAGDTSPSETGGRCADSLTPDMPGPENARLTQANLSRLRKNWMEATELCIEVLRESPGDQAAHSLLGDIYRDQGKPEEAVRWYRMALDLRPNPFDQSNLQQLERQISGRSIVDARKKRGSNFPPSIDPISGLPVGGTGALMGVPPQRWLRGITVTALSFLALFVIYLMFIPNKKLDTVPRSITPEALASDAQSGLDQLPPAKLGGATTLPAGEQPIVSAATGRVAGSGLAPDRGSATAPTMPQQGSLNNTTINGVPPAAVKSVSPLNGASASPYPGQMGIIRPSNSQITSHASNLAGGMELSRVEAGQGSAAISIVAANVSNASSMRDAMVRNVYRAARTVFSNDNTLQRATVTVHSGSADGEGLLYAEIDRTSALGSDPDTDDLTALTARLRLH